MNFQRFSISKYGKYDSLDLPFADKPGLTVAYGPNEAGKSTCLAAIADFLFGIPHTSSHGQVFGKDAIRLSATLRLSTGDALSLCRRNGRTKTLTNGEGRVVDEAVLLSVLGAMTRDRFSALFGLDHKSLRTGGEQLLAADGDIGRLIIEAGGGLRTLVSNVETLRNEADSLFSTRRSGERAFYKVLDTFAAADKDFKAGLLTHDRYEVARSAHHAATSNLIEHRAEQRTLRERHLESQRLIRIVPLLMELDQITGEMAGYSNIQSLRDDFAASARQAWQRKLDAQQSRTRAEESKAAVQAEVSALVISHAILAAEPAIRDIEKNALHLRKQREEKPHRQHELDEQQSKLMTLRQSIGAEPNADLSSMLPPKAVLKRVQLLATEAIKDKSTLASLASQIEEDAASISDLTQLQSELINVGFDKPIGLSTSDFASAVQLSRKLDAARHQVKQQRDALGERILQIGFSTVDELQAFSCPDASVIQRQIDLEASLSEELAKQLNGIATYTASMNTAIAGIERLRKGGEVPTEETILAARSARSASWDVIRDVYVSSDERALVTVPQEQRNVIAHEFEAHVSTADQLSDRRSVEANRIASLEVSERELAASKSSLSAASVAKTELCGELSAIRESFANTWANALSFEPNLGKLKLLSDTRAKILADAEEATAAEFVAEGLQADYDAALDSVTSAEASLGIIVAPGTAISTRIQQASRKIKQHDDSYGDYRSRQELIRSTNQRLVKRQNENSALKARHAEQVAEWTNALAMLKLNEDSSPARVNEVATQWAAADGVIDSINLTQRRLKRMDEDELALKNQLAALGPTLELELPDDCVAAAEMLKTKLDGALKTSATKDSLLPQMARLETARKHAQAEFEAAGVAVTGLCEEASFIEAELLVVAERQEARASLLTRNTQLLQTIAVAGDGIAIDTLRGSQEGRSVDTIRVDLQETESEIGRLSELVEADIRAEQENQQVLSRFESDDCIITHSAERERAIAEMEDIVERYVELALATDLLDGAIDQIRNEQQDPLILRAGRLFSMASEGAFQGIETDVDQKGNPIVVGKRAAGSTVSVANMSDGTRDQLFLAFRIASIEHYCAVAEPLPFIADDLLVHFDDERSMATLKLLAELGRTTQVLLFTHHRSVRDGVSRISRDSAAIIDLISPAEEQRVAASGGA